MINKPLLAILKKLKLLVIQRVDDTGRSVVVHAAQLGHHEMVKALIEKKCHFISTQQDEVYNQFLS